MSEDNSVLSQLRQPYWIALGGTLFVYVLLRALVWQQTTQLEDHDSTGLLRWTQTMLTLDRRAIVALDPDASLFFPFFAALFSVPGWSLETAARLVSFASSLLLFAVVIGIGRQLSAPVAAIIVALILLAFNPELVPLSISVLTEPSYVATVYLGLLVFWLQYRDPTLAGAALAGLIFGLAFLNRLEGILFLAFVPLMLGLYWIWQRPARYSAGRAFTWCTVFAVVFSAIAGMQIWRVSHEMGSLAVNGRQAWTLLLHMDGIGDTYHERIYGLAFDPGEVNVMHAKGNIRALSGVASDEGVLSLARSYVRTLILNLDDLYSNRITALFGHLVAILFAFGLLALYKAGRRFELALILGFIAVGLAAPLLHNVAIRHIIVIAPVVMLVAGIGAESLARSLTEGSRSRWFRSTAVVSVLVCAVVAGWALPLRSAIVSPDANTEYSVEELRGPIAAIATVRAEDMGATPRLVARRAYLAWFAGAEHIRMPFTDYAGLVRYLELNDVALLYLTRETGPYPFSSRFESGGYDARFELLYRGADAQGNPVALYRFRRQGGLTEQGGFLSGPGGP